MGHNHNSDPKCYEYLDDVLSGRFHAEFFRLQRKVNMNKTDLEGQIGTMGQNLADVATALTSAFQALQAKFDAVVAGNVAAEELDFQEVSDHMGGIIDTTKGLKALADALVSTTTAPAPVDVPPIPPVPVLPPDTPNT